MSTIGLTALLLGILFDVFVPYSALLCPLALLVCALGILAVFAPMYVATTVSNYVRRPRCLICKARVDLNVWDHSALWYLPNDRGYGICPKCGTVYTPPGQTPAHVLLQTVERKGLSWLPTPTQRLMAAAYLAKLNPVPVRTLAAALLRLEVSPQELDEATSQFLAGQGMRTEVLPDRLQTFLHGIDQIDGSGRASDPMSAALLALQARRYGYSAE